MRWYERLYKRVHERLRWNGPVRSLLAGIALLLLAAGSARAGDGATDEIEARYLRAVELMTQGRHEEAAKAFEELIKLEPLHAGAWLELAINHCTMGRTADAERLFREIEVRFMPSPGILEIIENHRRTGCKPWEARSYRNLSLSAGYDDNVNQGASNPILVIGSGEDQEEKPLTDEFLPKPDSFVQGTFGYSRELDRSGAVAFAHVRFRHHRDVSEQNTMGLLLGVDKGFRIGNWNGDATLSTSFLSLGGSLYQRQFQVQGRVIPPLRLPWQTEFILTGSFGRTQYVTRRNFDANTGELGAQLAYRGKANVVQLATGGLIEHGRADRLGGDRHGWYGSLQWQYQHNDRFGTEAGLTRQDWNSARVYAPELIDIARRQSTRQARLAMVYRLDARQSAVLEYRHVDNKENITLFQYDSHALQLYWRWNGF